VAGAARVPGDTEVEASDPLADLRAGRGWIDQMDERQLWAMLIRVRWPHGARCPRCGEADARYVRLMDAHYRGGLGRWQCQVCALAGDPGQAGTFTPLTSTCLDGLRVEVRTLWLIIEALAQGQASLETAKEARVHRHTTDRLFRLLRAALYQARPTEPLALNPDDIAECDEVYLTAGLKGKAGGLNLERPPRRRGLKRRGRGNWDSDRLPVFGVLCRGGQVRLFVLRNVQTETIRPIVRQLIRRGAKVYTDSYAIYHFLEREGYHHQAVNHGAGEYALDPDGDGHCEVHCNTLECTWSWLRPMVRTYRGISKVYLPLYVAHFEFLFNRRQQNHWNRTLDVLQVAFQADATHVADWLARVAGADFAEVCPVAG
jgi:transposase-like protein